MTSTLTVFYNSACPVCDAGICYQQALMSIPLAIEEPAPPLPPLAAIM